MMRPFQVLAAAPLQFRTRHTTLSIWLPSNKVSICEPVSREDRTF